MLNPSNMNFEDLSFENAISASQFETIKNIEQLLIGNNSPSSEGTSASFIVMKVVLLDILKSKHLKTLNAMLVRIFK